MQNINWIDGVVYAIILLSVTVGAMRGVLSALLGMSALALAFFVAWTRPAVIEEAVHTHIGIPISPAGLSALIFVFGLLIFGFIARRLDAALSKVDMAGLNAIGGAMFGLARGAIVAMGFVLILSSLGFSGAQAWSASHTLPPLGRALQWVVAHPIIAPYTGWLDFDAGGRPLIVSGRPPSVPVREREEAAAEEQQPSEQSSEQSPEQSNGQAEEESQHNPEAGQSGVKQNLNQVKKHIKRRDDVLGDTVQHLENHVAVPSHYDEQHRRAKAAQRAKEEDDAEGGLQVLNSDKYKKLKETISCELKGEVCR